MSNRFVELRADVLAESTDGIECNTSIKIECVTDEQLVIILHDFIKEVFKQCPFIRRRLMLRLMGDDLTRMLDDMTKKVETEG